MKPVLLNIQQAAERKGLTAATIYSAIAHNRLPRRYSKGNLVVREADLLAWDLKKKKAGRPKGQAISEEHRARIAASQRERWKRRKNSDREKSETK